MSTHWSVDRTTPTRLGGVPRAPSAAGRGRAPDFLIIGACKAGTTTLWKYLNRHPGVWLLEPKEPDFFSKQERYAKGMDWYKSLFAPADEGRLCGEASTTYSRWPHFGDVPGRIADAMPDARLIYIMRHPVERAYSHYRHRMRLEVERMSFEEAIESDPMFTDCSLYLMQLQKFYERFPRERVHTIVLDDLAARPAETLGALQRFLGVAVVDLAAESRVHANEASSGGEDFTRRRLVRWAEKCPGVGALRRAAPRGVLDGVVNTVVRSPIGRWISGRYEPGPLTPETRRRLLDVFRRPTEELEAHLGRALPGWRE